MTITPWLAKAGRFDVEKIGGIPHENMATYLNTPRTGVVHTTEGDWAGSLSVFQQHYAPHFMLGLDPVQKRVRIVQLVQVGTIGAALVTHNWLAMVQVEVIGFSKQTLWMPDEETAEALASLMAVCEIEYGIPLTHPWPDGVYGMARADDPHRNHGEFGKVAGWFGHGDVPVPDSHWDPGALKWSALFAMAKAIEAAPQAKPTPLPHPCAACAVSAAPVAATATPPVSAAAAAAQASLDTDLIGAVSRADPATKVAIMKSLSGG